MGILAEDDPRDVRRLRRRVLAWYDRHRRELPWRAPPGAKPDPYRVWLSEVMLQQTTVATVIGRFEGFLARWPTVADLARAPLADVLDAWQGLGYYARARHLHACARAVVGQYRGAFPRTEDELRRLPGVGPYSAAAIAAIAFGRRATPVDGNVARLVARLFAVGAPLPGARKRIAELARTLAPARRTGDFAQALMDLGATVCTPRNPHCPRCPCRGLCAAAASGRPEHFPPKTARRIPPVRFEVAFWIEDVGGAVLLRRRPAEGLLGGMMEIPSTPWRARRWRRAEAVGRAPCPARWRRLPGTVRHGFSHFRLELAVLAGKVGARRADGAWCPPQRLMQQALPTVMKKIVSHALAARPRRRPADAGD